MTGRVGLARLWEGAEEGGRAVLAPESCSVLSNTVLAERVRSRDLLEGGKSGRASTRALLFSLRATQLALSVAWTSTPSKQPWKGFP